MINSSYDEQQVIYKDKVIKHVHPVWKEFCTLFPALAGHLIRLEIQLIIS